MVGAIKVDALKRAEELPILNLPPRPSRARRFIVYAIYVICASLLLLALLDLVVLPMAVYNFSQVREKIVFPSYLSFGGSEDFSDPSAFGLKNAKNFQLQTPDGITLGVWSIPAARSTEVFSGEVPTVIFCHGNLETRAASYYIEKYQLFTSLGVDVITFDYRGYGDSSSVQATVPGIVIDTMTVYEYVRKNIGADRILMWGHSLGSGIVMQILNRIDDDVPIILEAPSTTMGNAVYNNYFSFPMRVVPSMKPYFVDAIDSDPNTSLDSISASKKYNSTKPVLVLASENDSHVDPEQSKEVFKTLSETPNSNDVVFKYFNGTSGTDGKANSMEDEYLASMKTYLEGIFAEINEEMMEEMREAQEEGNFAYDSFTG